MGRYYNGDINGKFWFGVQPSDTADRFGGTHEEPNYINYYFGESDLDEVIAELNRIEAKLGKWVERFDDFFENTNGYNDQIVADYGLDVEEFNNNLRDYADWQLGNKIRKCIEENGGCYFEAEL